MKILQLIYSLKSGGAEKFVVNLSNQLASQGHEVIICMLLDDKDASLSFNKRFISPNVLFVSLGLTKGFSLKKSYLVQKYIINEKPDIVHCHLNVIPYVFSLSFFLNNIKFVHTLHSIAEKTSGSRLQCVINKFFYQRSIITPVVISKECLISFENYYKIKKPYMIENGCPAIKPTPMFNAVRNEVLAYKRNVNTRVFIHVARCHPAKNQKLLIDVFNRLYSNHFNFLLLILGAGYDSSEGQHLKLIANKNVHFLDEKDNVSDYLLLSDFFCLTSVYEGLPISLLEAMSCGVLPICTPVGGMKDVIRNGYNGFLSSGVDLESYYNIIADKCFEDAVHISKDDVINTYCDKYSISACANEYVKLFKYLLDK